MNAYIQEHLAKRVAECRLRHAQVVERQAAAQSMTERLSRDIAALEAREGCCAVRGIASDGNTAGLGAELRTLRAQHARALDEARAISPSREFEELRIAEDEWARHIAHARYVALQARAHEIERLFVAAVRQVHSAGRAIGRCTVGDSYRLGPEIRSMARHNFLPPEVTHG